jgi:hypothetical protein
MKSGTYRVTLEVEIKDCQDKDEATNSLMAMFSEMIDDDLVPEVDFELLEEFDIEYQTEDEVQELEF